MSITELLLPTYRQMLQALAAWLRKAQGQVQGADALMAVRLAPDMFPLSTQVRFACLQAREGGHRLRHEPFPSALDELLDEGRKGGERPGTIAEALARIDEALAYLDGITPAALDEGAERPLALELPMGLAFDLNGQLLNRCAGQRGWTTRPEAVVRTSAAGSQLQWRDFIHSNNVVGLGNGMFLNQVLDPAGERTVFDLVTQDCRLLRRTSAGASINMTEAVGTQLIAVRNLEFPEVLVYERRVVR